MRRFLFIVALAFIYTSSFGQGPAINGDERPRDNEGIYVEKITETRNWDDFMGGFKKGTKIPDLTFYTVDGQQITLSTVLKETHKPVLLISGNYSCPVFRRNLEEINSITNYYKDKLNVYVVYTIEAHPMSGTQAYPLIPPAVKKNEMDKINMKQAACYLDRRKAVAKMSRHLSIVPTVVLDGPQNEWWSYSGQAPNNAYLINTKGLIVAKNGWFGNSMWCSVDHLLHSHSGHCRAK